MSLIVDQFGREISAAKRNHDAARTTRFTSDWIVSNSPLDRYLTQDLTELQNRSASLEMNDGYARRFFQELEANVIGEAGISFKARCRKADGRYKGKTPPIDEGASSAIEQAWEEFSRKENFTASRRFTRRRFEQLAVRQVARLGGLLVRMVRGYENKFGFSVHPISVRNLSPRHNDPQRNIHMGIEFDDWGAVRAFHVTKQGNKADTRPKRETERLPAGSVIHLYMSDDFDQSQGKPWLTSSMLRLRMLGKYEEAETIAAIEHANNATYFEQNEFTEYVGEEDEFGNIREKSEPGQKTILPRGLSAKQVQPMHPNTVYPDFRKAVLRGVASNLIVSYNTLANDLEGVNYSSIRQGVLAERELWKIIQCWFIDDFETELFKAWLPQAIITGELSQFSIADIGRLSHVEFSGRRWSWVDPVKDVMAAQKEIALSINTRGRVAREHGRGDFEKLAVQNAEEEKTLIENQLLLPLADRNPSASAA